MNHHTPYEPKENLENHIIYGNEADYNPVTTHGIDTADIDPDVMIPSPDYNPATPI